MQTCSLLLVALLAGLSAGSILDDSVLRVPADVFAAALAPTTRAEFNCNLVQLRNVQYQFNQFIGINTSITYTEGTALWDAVEPVMDSGVPNYLQVCGGRIHFFQSLGATYSDCTNPLFLVSHLPPGSNITEAFAYAAFWPQLNFVCNGGLEIGLQSYSDLVSIYSHPDAITCVNTFVSSIHHAGPNICGPVSTYMNCIQQVYTTYATIKTNGWWLCERIRVSYGQYCPFLRCNVIV